MKLPAGSSKDIDVTMEYTGNNPEDVGSVEADVNLDYVSRMDILTQRSTI